MMQYIRLRVAGGPTAVESRRWPCRDDVRQEAQRRINASGYTRARARALATGAAIPEAFRRFALQVAAVADRLSAAAPIPNDFQSDSYWPAFERPA